MAACFFLNVNTFIRTRTMSVILLKVLKNPAALSYALNNVNSDMWVEC